MFRISCVMGAVLAALLSCAYAADTNLLPDGDFSTTTKLGPWVGQVVWNSDDAHGSAASGSLEVDATILEPDIMFFTGSGGSACFTVRPGAAYRFGGQSRALTAGGVGVSFFCSAWNQADCLGMSTFLKTLAMPNSMSWTPAVSVSGVLPSDAVSVDCDAEVGEPILSGSAIFDNLFFTTDVIFFNSFDPPVP